MKAFFVRHGETNYNVLGLCNADPNVPVHLTQSGKLQAEALALRLRDAPIDAVYVSRLPRTRETADIINRCHEARVFVDPRLDDRRNGFDGRSVHDYLAAVADDPINTRPPGGETYRELKERVGSFVEELRLVAARGVLVVTHHEVLQVVNGLFNGLSEEAMWRTWIDNGSLLQFEL